MRRFKNDIWYIIFSLFYIVYDLFVILLVINMSTQFGFVEIIGCIIMSLLILYEILKIRHICIDSKKYRRK
jgi:hypothetical protein